LKPLALLGPGAVFMFRASLSSSVEPVAFDLPVPQPNGAGRVMGDFLIVSDENESLSSKTELIEEL
jgi:hypothetical protein